MWTTVVEMKWSYGVTVRVWRCFSMKRASLPIVYMMISRLTFWAELSPRGSLCSHLKFPLTKILSPSSSSSLNHNNNHNHDSITIAILIIIIIILIIIMIISSSPSSSSTSSTCLRLQRQAALVLEGAACLPLTWLLFFATHFISYSRQQLNLSF